MLEFATDLDYIATDKKRLDAFSLLPRGLREPRGTHRRNTTPI
jgi:hypothetical protein